MKIFVPLLLDDFIDRAPDIIAYKCHNKMTIGITERLALIIKDKIYYLMPNDIYKVLLSDNMSKNALRKGSFICAQYSKELFNTIINSSKTYSRNLYIIQSLLG